MSRKPMTDQQILEWIAACNHEAGRQVLRDYMRLRDTLPSAERFVEVYNQSKAHVILSNTDLTEGKGDRFPLGVYRLEVTATRYAKGAYVMGADAPVVEVPIYGIGGHWYGPIKIIEAEKGDLTAQKALDDRRAAIKKAKDAGLTERDIALLATAVPT
jgi:hypothetical protein